MIFSKTFWRNAMTLSSKLSNKVGKIYLMKIQTFWEKKIIFDVPLPGASNFKLLSNFKNSKASKPNFIPSWSKKKSWKCATRFLRRKSLKLRVRRNKKTENREKRSSSVKIRKSRAKNFVLLLFEPSLYSDFPPLKKIKKLKLFSSYFVPCK